jgi:nitroreductase
MNAPLISHETLKKSITKSQHCQRNWDLTKQIPEQDLELLIHAATQCPSKQNMVFYGVHFITNREIIEKIHSYTDGFLITTPNSKKTITTNTQTLANLLIVFEDINITEHLKNNPNLARSPESKIAAVESDEIKLEKLQNNLKSDINYMGKFPQFTVKKDMHMAMGIAAGYVNLTANILGYSTGCCACMRDAQEISKLIGISGSPILLMGVGFKDYSRPRREHHLDSNLVFQSYKKQNIPTSIIR